MRLDRWLWAARFYKTRSMAAAAIAGGKVRLRGQRPKRAAAVQMGDEVRVRKGPFEQVVIVRGLDERRRPPAEAAALYEETAASRVARERRAEELRAQPTFDYPEGKPTKRDRRQLERFKRGQQP
jgi:ribosome-associated heat shock protein Hsp15